MATEGLGIAVIPSAIVEGEMADGRLQMLSTDIELPPLTFSASWLASPDTVAVELVADLAVKLAQSGQLTQASPSDVVPLPVAKAKAKAKATSKPSPRKRAG
jgi:hypothetical protein